jgi:hypothetical protein
VSPPTWLDLWAFARVRIGLGKAEFFSLTPRSFARMHEVWLERERDTHRMFALLRVDLINHSFYRPTKPLELADLMPARPGAAGSGRPRRRRLTKKFRGQIADRMRQIFGAPAEPAGS